MALVGDRYLVDFYGSASSVVVKVHKVSSIGIPESFVDRQNVIIPHSEVVYAKPMDQNRHFTSS